MDPSIGKSAAGEAGGLGGLPGARQPLRADENSGFADMLKGSINEVSRLQQDASQAVEKLVTGQTDDLAGVMAAMEKSDVAFKTLLAIRSKLMDAYEEIKNLQV